MNQPPRGAQPAGPPAGPPAASDASVEHLVLELKDTSEMMVDLAYSALFYDSKSIARVVQELEEDAGAKLTLIQRGVLDAVAAGHLGTDHALVLLRVAQAAETIADSALEIADVVLRDVELHPVVLEAIRESDTAITKATVHARSPLAGRTLAEKEVESETGMRIVAVKRGKAWRSRIEGDFRLEAGDTVVATGPREAEAAFLQQVDPSA